MIDYLGGLDIAYHGGKNTETARTAMCTFRHTVLVVTIRGIMFRCRYTCFFFLLSLLVFFISLTPHT